MQNKKSAGVWLDQTQAFIAINHDGREVSDFHLVDSVTAVIQHGNSNENTGNNAGITNRHKFFKNILEKLTNTEELFLTGTGTIQEEFKSYLLETPQFKNTKVILGTSQQMSEEQVLEEVKKHFGS